jgi:hypothetical protein
MTTEYAEFYIFKNPLCASAVISLGYPLSLVYGATKGTVPFSEGGLSPFLAPGH